MGATLGPNDRRLLAEETCAPKTLAHLPELGVPAEPMCPFGSPGRRRDALRGFSH